MTTNRGELLARYRRIGTDAAAHGQHVPPPPAPITPVHRQVVALLDELLGFVPADAGPFTSLIRALRALEPVLLRDFAKVPPAQVVAFLHQLGARMMAVGGETDGAGAATHAAGAGLDQSASA